MGIDPRLLSLYLQRDGLPQTPTDAGSAPPVQVGGGLVSGVPDSLTRPYLGLPSSSVQAPASGPQATTQVTGQAPSDAPVSPRSVSVYTPGLTGPIDQPSELPDRNPSGPVTSPSQLDQRSGTLQPEGPVRTPAEVPEGGKQPVTLPPAPPTPEENYEASQHQILAEIDADDPASIARGAFKMGAVAADEKGRQTGQALAQYNSELGRMQAEQAQRDRELQTEAQEATDKVQAAADNLRQSAPDPSVLWGGQGSWGRALVTVMAAGALGGPSTGAVVSTALTMGMRDQDARFQAAREDVIASQASQQAKLLQLKGIDDSYAAHRIAMAQSLAGAVSGIDNSVMPAQAKAVMLQALGKDIEKQKDDAFKNNLELAKANKLGGGGGGGVGPTSPMSRLTKHPISQIDEVPEKDQDKIVKSDDGQYYWVVQSATEADKMREAIRGTKSMRAATTIIINTLGSGDGTGSWWDKAKAKLKVNSPDIAKVRAQMMTLKAAYAKAMGEKTNPRVMAAFDHAIDDPANFSEQDLIEITAISNSLLDEQSAALPGDLIGPSRFPELAGPPVAKPGDTPAGDDNVKKQADAEAAALKAKQSQQKLEADAKANEKSVEADAGPLDPNDERSTDPRIDGAYKSYVNYHSAFVDALKKGYSADVYQKWLAMKTAMQVWQDIKKNTYTSAPNRPVSPGGFH